MLDLRQCRDNRRTQDEAIGFALRVWRSDADHPLYLHDAAKRNRRIGSLDAKLLKSPGRICPDCNNARTQPHDRAWEKLSEALRDRSTSTGAGKCRASRRSVFRYDTARAMLNVHLYFVKLFGCHIAGNAIPLDIASFANAILHQKAHPCVYVKFGCGRTSAGEPMTGMSDMWLAPSLFRQNEHVRDLVL